MQYIIYYLLGGVLFNFIYDLLIDKLGDKSLRFSTTARIIFGLVWPFYVLAFIRNFFIYFFKNKQDD